MADQKITDFGSIPATVDLDVVAIVDVSDVTDDIAGSSFKATLATLLAHYNALSATLTNKTFNANGAGNSITNIENADIAAAAAIAYSKLAALTDGNILVGNVSNVPVSVNPSGDVDISNAGVLSLNADAVDLITEIAAALKSGVDAILITGTAGTDGNISQWNGDGDLVDGPTPPSGSIVGISDAQTLTNKTLDADNNTVSNLAHGAEVDNPTTGHGATGAVVGTTNTQTLTNKTLTAPTLADFTNAAHDHGDADDGGNIVDGAVPATHSGSAHHTKYTDAEAISAVEGEATLDLVGDVTIAGTKTLAVDVISEKDAAAGVTIDGALIKDGAIADGAVPATHSGSAHHSAEPAASVTVAGIVELATAAETTTGTDAGRAVTPDGLAGSDVMGGRAIQMLIFEFATDVATGDGKFYFHVDQRLVGMNVVDVHAEVITAGTTGTTDIQIANVTQAADILSTKLTIDSGETGSDTAATAAVIDGAQDDLQLNDLIRIDVDAISTTAPKGLIITIGCRLP